MLRMAFRAMEDLAMKANRKFLKGDEDAVSPVIAVILMVAITVVLAATVYVWVSGFGGGGGQQKSLALSSAGSIDSTSFAGDFVKSYTVASATSGMKYQDIKLTLDGAEQTFDATACGANLGANANWGACAGSTERAADAVIQAGDVIRLRTDATSSGQTLRILDTQANSVILTLVIG
jgi:archaeal type IV pilus assembly protein PilA